MNSKPTTMREKAAFIAGNATVLGDVTLEEGTSVWYGAVLRGDKAPIVLRKNANIQDNCIVHVSTGHKVEIGENVSVGHGAIIHGATIRPNTLIGMGAIILNDAVIGEGSIVGAGALVSEGKEIPPRSLVLGVPGKIVRQVTDAEFEGIVANAAAYETMAKNHAAGEI